MRDKMASKKKDALEEIEALEETEALDSKKTVRIIIYIAALTLIFMASFLVSFKFALDSGIKKANQTAINIEMEDRIPVFIPLGSSTPQIAQILKDNGFIKNTFVFRFLSSINGYDGEYKSGTHILSKKLTYDEIMTILASNPAGIKVTLPEGYTVKQIVEKLENEKLINAEEFYQIADSEPFDYTFVENIPRTENRLEGYLFPDTYEFDLNTGSKEIISRMLQNFDNKFPTRYYEQAKQLNMTADQIIILASIIEKEAKVAAERPIISSVFHNRLNGKNGASRKLESCATIQFIYMDRFNEYKSKITDSDKKIDDPYNTYMYEGLPPGPICNPGKAAIEAALNPAYTDYIYFVAKGDGTHYFSKTLEEHNAAIIRYGAY